MWGDGQGDGWVWKEEVDLWGYSEGLWAKRGGEYYGEVGEALCEVVE